MTEKNIQLTEDVKELVIARLDIMPPNYKLSIGSQGTFTKDELIKHVKDGDLVGNQIAKMQYRFIKALTTGKLVEVLNNG